MCILAQAGVYSRHAEWWATIDAPTGNAKPRKLEECAIYWGTVWAEKASVEGLPGFWEKAQKQTWTKPTEMFQGKDSTSATRPEVAIASLNTNSGT